MSKGQKSNKETKKKAALTPKEKQAWLGLGLDRFSFLPAAAACPPSRASGSDCSGEITPPLRATSEKLVIDVNMSPLHAGSFIF